MGFSQGSSGADHPHPTASESCQPSLTQGSSLKLLGLIYSFPSCLSRVVENFLFCIILLTKRKESWVGWRCVCLPPSYGRKKKRKRKKLTREAWKEINVEKMVVMENRKSVTVIPLSVDNFFQTGCDKYLRYLKTKKIYFQVFLLF